MDSSPTLVTRESCIGWHCLNASQKFGTIFSIVIFFVVLSIVFMFYLGRAKVSYERRNAAATAGSINVRQPHTTTYTKEGRHFFIHRSTPYAVHTEEIPPPFPMPVLSPRAAVWPQHPAVPVSTMVLPTAYPMGHVPSLYTNQFVGNSPHIQQGNFNVAQDESQYSTNAAPLPMPTQAEPMPQGWLQRLQRALQISPGRASTLASRSPSVASHRLETGTTTTRHGQPTDIATNETHDTQYRTGIPTNTNSSISSPGFDTASVDTAAAAVHSDDFELPMSRGVVPSMTSVGSHAAGGGMTDPPNGILEEKRISGVNSRSDTVTKEEPPPRVSRESRRRAWETKQRDTDRDSDSDSSAYEPLAPKAIHQGRGYYSWWNEATV